MKPGIWRGKHLQRRITACCLLSFTLFGYGQGVFGGILQNTNWLDQFEYPSDSKTGLIVSSYNLGCLVGCIISFLIGGRIGCRKGIWLAMSFVVVGAFLQAAAYHTTQLIAGRIVSGLGTGLQTSTVPMYQAELCPPAFRGRLISAQTLFLGVGVVFAYWFDFGMSFAKGPLSWRLPVAFQTGFAVGVSLLMLLLPESPRWLFTQGRNQEAVDTLCAVYDKDPENKIIVAEMTAILHALKLETITKRKALFCSISANDSIRTGYRILLACGIQFMNQASGINLVVYYIPSILVQNAGMSTRTAQVLGGCINMMFMIGSILPSLALDRMGRRRTMMAGCLGLGICMLMVSALLSQAEVSTNRGHIFASASIAFFFLYMLIFGMSVNSVPWVYVPEILPLAARARGAAIGTASSWLWNFTIVMITPVITNRLRWKAYTIFMVMNFLFIPTVYFFYPETSNLRLEDIDYIFSTKGNPVSIARGMMRSTGNIDNAHADSRNTSDKDIEMKG